MIRTVLAALLLSSRPLRLEQAGPHDKTCGLSFRFSMHTLDGRLPKTADCQARSAGWSWGEDVSGWPPRGKLAPALVAHCPADCGVLWKYDA